ncbi:DUF3618 domain-containing protein [Micromonospora halotolerans]|uniref:DUF3618 domain-containing protein n=1 Tax=Micromonospora halotolerans TaxID=709879 RepID=A0ABY9ZY54_9ACTN|nr:DUF3618 domain-containing protein [Micromonospora halotolerans]WNM40231.1 DUF3618 domain-containing protein [Micromonospora halotolerans]
MSTDPDRIRSEIESTRSELSSDVDALTDKMNPRRIAGERVGQARGALTRVKEKVMGAQMDGHGAGQRMSQTAGSVRDEARSLGQQSRAQTQGNPLAAGLIAFGAGLLVSSLIPPSRPERQWAGQARGMVGEHSAGLRQQASQVGNQLRDQMREPAQQAAQSVRSTAAQGASAVRDQGRSTAHQMQDETREAAGEMRHR